ncbi:MAG: DUF1573 domain-containing protein [Maioricimonas sp. JB045]
MNRPSLAGTIMTTAGCLAAATTRNAAEVWTARMMWASAVLLAVVVGRNAWQAYSQYRHPPALSCSQPVFEFGTAISGDPISHTFTVKNVGRSPLEILDVHAQCGCTTVRDTLKGQMVPPGEQFDVPVTLQTTPSDSGPLEKSLSIRFAGDSQRKLTLTVKGIVEPPWTWSPAIVSLADVSRETADSRQILVRQHPDLEPAEVTHLSQSPFLDATFRRAPDAVDGNRWIIDVRPSNDASPGRHEGAIYFSTTDSPELIGPIRVIMTVPRPAGATAGPSAG